MIEFRKILSASALMFVLCSFHPFSMGVENEISGIDSNIDSNIDSGIDSNIDSNFGEQLASFAALDLRQVYVWETGVNAETLAAFKWWKAEAIRGNVAAMHNVAVAYERGVGVLVSDKDAFNWYNLASLNGSAAAQRQLGRYYLSGIGVKKNINKGYMWLVVAHANGENLTDQLESLREFKPTSTVCETGHEDKQLCIDEAQAMAKVCFESNYSKCW